MERIGRYTVERLIARGGMAEVFLARAEGPAGFSKTVVIKRILPEFASDAQFVHMFLDEARLAALLSHPNVVQVFDFGEDQGVYFIAMEYIQGDSVRSAIRYFQARASAFPPRLAAQVMVGACEGLQYAHGLTDEHGASHNIVHRDVSPENILISTSGIPKIVDFGIAKAAHRTTRTEAGALKGKYAYMPPEQIRGEGVDRRVDVYALGVTLYEMVTGRHPFEAPNEFHLFQTVLAGNAAPAHAVNPEVPAELGAIVAQAMAADRELRFRSASQMQSALEDFVAATGPRIPAAELATFVADVIRDRKGDQPPHRSSGPKAVTGFPPAGAALPPADVDAKIAIPPTYVRPAAAPESPPSAAPVPPPPAVPASGGLAAIEDALGLRPRRRRVAIAGVTAATLVAVGTAGLLALRGGSSASSPAAVPATTAAAVPPSGAATQKTAEPAVPAAVAEATARAPAGPANAARPRAAPSGRGSSRRAAVAEGDGYLTLRTDPWCDVYVDGERIGTTPLARSPLPAGRRTVELRNDAVGAYRKLSLVVSAGEEARQVVLFRKGTLVVSVQPAAEVSLNGRLVGTTPIEPLEVVEGEHELRLVNSQLGRDERRRVRVTASRAEVVKVVWR